MMSVEEQIARQAQRISELQGIVNGLAVVTANALQLLQAEVQRLEKRIEALDGIQP